MKPASPAAELLQLSIRFAQPRDAKALAGLRYALRSSIGVATEPEADFLKRCAAWMEEKLADDTHWRCLVAEVDEELIGAIWIQIIEKIPNPRNEPERHAYGTNFYVRENSRRQGIGSRLLREAIDWCRSQEVHAVIIWPSKDSRSLYDRHGFAARDDIMELLIADV